MPKRAPKNKSSTRPPKARAATPAEVAASVAKVRKQRAAVLRKLVEYDKAQGT